MCRFPVDGAARHARSMNYIQSCAAWSRSEMLHLSFAFFRHPCACLQKVNRVVEDAHQEQMAPVEMPPASFALITCVLLVALLFTADLCPVFCLFHASVFFRCLFCFVPCYVSSFFVCILDAPIPLFSRRNEIEWTTAEFRSYFEYCRSLRFEDRPDYAYLKVRTVLAYRATIVM